MQEVTFSIYSLERDFIIYSPTLICCKSYVLKYYSTSHKLFAASENVLLRVFRSNCLLIWNSLKKKDFYFPS